MSHADAALTPIAGLRLGKLIVEEGWSVSAAADYYRVSWPTAKRWADPYREQSAVTTRPVTSHQLQDRSSRPLRSPRKPAVPATDKREDRTVPPHPGRRLGLSPPLPVRARPPQRSAAWIHHYNHHRLHTAIGKVPPITRLTNVPGQYY